MIEPKLRFKADDGSQFPNWEEKTFNDVADVYARNKSYSRCLYNDNKVVLLLNEQGKLHKRSRNTICENYR